MYRVLTLISSHCEKKHYLFFFKIVKCEDTEPFKKKKGGYVYHCGSSHLAKLSGKIYLKLCLPNKVKVNKAVAPTNEMENDFTDTSCGADSGSTVH